MVFLYILVGIAGGIIGGMGLGGGTLLIPALTLFLDVDQKIAATINLVSFIPMSIISCIIHAKNKLIDFKSALLLALPASASCIAFSFIAQNIKGDLLSQLFGFFLIALALLMLIPQCISAIKSKLK